MRITWQCCACQPYPLSGSDLPRRCPTRPGATPKVQAGSHVPPAMAPRRDRCCHRIPPWLPILSSPGWVDPKLGRWRLSRPIQPVSGLGEKYQESAPNSNHSARDLTKLINALSTTLRPRIYFCIIILFIYHTYASITVLRNPMHIYRPEGVKKFVTHIHYLTVVSVNY